jgi:hypothetical protein
MTKKFTIGNTYHFIRNQYAQNSSINDDIYYSGSIDLEIIQTHIVSAECISSHKVPVDMFPELITQAFIFKSTDNEIFFNQYPIAQYSHTKSIVQYSAKRKNDINDWMLVDIIYEQLNSKLLLNSQEKRIMKNILKYIKPISNSMLSAA